MTPELYALACTVLIQCLTLGLLSVFANRELGSKVTAGTRDGQMPPVSPRLGRTMRALSNGFESLAMFAPAVLVVVVSGQSDTLTTIAAWLHVAARLLYVPAYILGLVPWRSAIWGLGFLATLILLVSALV